MIAEGPLFEALEGVHSGRLRVQEAYRQIRAAETRDAVADLVEALRLTVEYVGLETLPPVEGWSWFDALQRHAPEIAAHFVEQQRGLKAAP